MKQSTIKLHTHEIPSRNSLHTNAWAIAYRATDWGWQNLLYWFRPPKLEGVVIMPTDPEAVDSNEDFTADMFDEGGILADEPLNHYIKVRVDGLPEPLMINAAFLINNYLWGLKQGATTLKDLITRAKAKYWSEHTPTEVTG